ncbi:MAG: glycosyltransferase family 39 protein, partial [Nitrospirae bacterium]|nr:glycosyltransferase family 39 protein [Nitrospirota bacterium]
MTLHRILFILIFLLGVALRVIYLITQDLDSDQAIMGLMARHILDGEFPIFYWGERYAGPVESYFASIIFYIFGSSPLTLILSPFIFSLIFIFLVYRLGKEMFNEKVGLMAMLLVSASPPFLIWYSVSPSGNYIQNLVFGTLLLLMTFRFVNIVSDEKTAKRYYIVIGFVGGLAWWVNFQIAYFLLTAFIFMFLKDRWRFIKRGLLYLFPSFMIGSSLFWYYNLKNSWGSIDDIQRYSQKIKLSNSLIASFDFKLPFVLGPFAHRDTLYLGKYFIIVFGVLLLYFIFTYRRGLIDLFRLSIKRMTGAEILMVFFIIFSVVIISRYNYSTILRYYLPIYSVFPIILAVSIYNAGRVFKPLPLLLVVIFASFNIYGDIKGAVIFDSKKLKSYRESKERERVLFDSLISKGIRYVGELDYWKRYKFTFDSSEKVIFTSPALDWHPNKYPAYTEGLHTQSNPAFIIRKGISDRFDMFLKSQGISYAWEIYFDYHILFHSLKMPEKKGSVIPASTMIASSNYDEIDPKSAIDRDVTTEWTPLVPKDKPPHLEIDMKRPYLINRVSILNGGSFDNSPPSYELEVSLNREVWSKVISMPVQLGGFVSKDGV